jgi:hypothetical protein
VQPIENFTKHWAAKYEKIRAHATPVSFQFFQKKPSMDSKYAIDVNLVAPLNFLYDFAVIYYYLVSFLCSSILEFIFFIE